MPKVEQLQGRELEVDANSEGYCNKSRRGVILDCYSHVCCSRTCMVCTYLYIEVMSTFATPYMKGLHTG